MVLDAMKNYATLDELMENMNGKVVKVYSGKDDRCRCGCGGKYYYAGSKQFNAMLNRAKREYIKTREVCMLIETDLHGLSVQEKRTYRNFVYHPDVYVNIPRSDSNNKCYCVYFSTEDDEDKN